MKVPLFILIYVINVSLFPKASAIFYLEYRVACGPEKSVTKNFLYKCSNEKCNVTDGSPPYVIQCRLVYVPLLSYYIYATANFYVTHRPALAPCVVLLSLQGFTGKRTRYFTQADTLPSDLRVGFFPGPRDDPRFMDFPMFEEYGNHHHFNSLVAEISPLQALIAWYDVPKVAATLNTNIVSKTSKRWDFDYPHYVKVLGLFSTVLEKIRDKSQVKDPLTPENVEKLARLFLNKMIDPCPLPIPEQSRDRIDLNQYCKVHCQFLKVIMVTFQLHSFWCSTLRSEGRCQNGLCLCTQTALKIWTVEYNRPVKMLYCNNEFRLKVEQMGPTLVEKFG